MKNALLLGTIMLLSVQAWAAEGESKTTLKNVLGIKKFEEDKRITDNELKAQSGSLSRYSLKFDLSYSGPAVNDLSDPNMPNPDNRSRPNRTALTGYTGLRYRISPNAAANLSTGLRWYTPYQQITGEDTTKPKGENDYEISNPQVSYDRTYPVGQTQMRSSLKAVYVTSDYYQLRGETGGLGYTQAVKYQPFGTRLITGLALDLDYYFFNRGYQARWTNGQKGGDGKISNYYITYIPSLEYKVTDKFNLRTSVGFSYSNQRSAGNNRDWQELEPTGRLGFGYAFTREIYFSPYVGFYTKRPSLNTTNVAFSTVFSIF